MGLDIHKNNETREWLFSLQDDQLNALSSVFDAFFIQSGIRVDAYSDCILEVGMQKLLTKLIDQFATKNDLNQNRSATLHILSFRGFLVYTIAHQLSLVLYGD